VAANAAWPNGSTEAGMCAAVVGRAAGAALPTPTLIEDYEIEPSLELTASVYFVQHYQLPILSASRLSRGSQPR
jgi:hypothetical protein